MPKTAKQPTPVNSALRHVITMFFVHHREPETPPHAGCDQKWVRSKAPYRRLPSLLYRRFPNRQGLVHSENAGKNHRAQAGNHATQQTWKSAVRLVATSPTINHTRLTPALLLWKPARAVAKSSRAVTDEIHLWPLPPQFRRRLPLVPRTRRPRRGGVDYLGLLARNQRQPHRHQTSRQARAKRKLQRAQPAEKFRAT